MSDLDLFIHTLSAEISNEKLAAEDLSALSEDDLAFLAFGSDPVLMQKISGEVSYEGDVNSGEAKDPTWPDAALGAPESEPSKDTATPQHIEVQSGSKTAAPRPSGVRSLWKRGPTAVRKGRLDKLEQLSGGRIAPDRDMFGKNYHEMQVLLGDRTNTHANEKALDKIKKSEAEIASRYFKTAKSEPKDPKTAADGEVAWEDIDIEESPEYQKLKLHEQHRDTVGTLGGLLAGTAIGATMATGANSLMAKNPAAGIGLAAASIIPTLAGAPIGEALAMRTMDKDKVRIVGKQRMSESDQFDTILAKAMHKDPKGLFQALDNRSLQGMRVSGQKDKARWQKRLEKLSMSDAQQEKGLGRAAKGLARAKMDPDRKAGLAKGLAAAIKKEKREGDPVKLSASDPVS